MREVSEYIKNSWQKAVRKKDSDKNFPMPYDYVPPCVDGELINLYYWDTYFTNKGLYIDGLESYAYGNIENLKFCLRKFGCVPNMCRSNGACYASQPPLLFLMVEDYYEHTKNIDFLQDSYQALAIEYAFWMQKRICKNGLNHYGTNMAYDEMTESQARAAMAELVARLKLDISGWSLAQMQDFLIQRTSEGESGEDHTPRFQGKAHDVCALDLNCILYGFECTMAKFACALGEDESIWLMRAQERKDRLQLYSLDKESGVYFDYNYVEKKRTGIYCAACYLPYVFGLSKDAEALRKINKMLIQQYGVTSCQKIDGVNEIFQWGYPNAWAPHQYYAYLANKKCGDTEQAQKIASCWIQTVSEEFKKSGKLFEKYDAIVGGKATVNEYGTPEMLGWTAGVYKVFCNDELI